MVYITKNNTIPEQTVCCQYPVPTPKRKVGGSNPFWDARKHRCKPFSGFAAFLFALPKCDKGQYLSEHTKIRFFKHSTSKTSATIDCYPECAKVSHYFSGHFLIFCFRKLPGTVSFAWRDSGREPRYNRKPLIAADTLRNVKCTIRDKNERFVPFRLQSRCGYCTIIIRNIASNT